MSIDSEFIYLVNNTSFTNFFILTFIFNLAEEIEKMKKDTLKSSRLLANL